MACGEVWLRATLPFAVLCPAVAAQGFCCARGNNPLEIRGNHSATSNNVKLVHCPLIGGLLQYLCKLREDLCKLVSWSKKLADAIQG